MLKSVLFYVLDSFTFNSYDFAFNSYGHAIEPFSQVRNAPRDRVANGLPKRSASSPSARWTSRATSGTGSPSSKWS